MPGNTQQTRCPRFAWSALALTVGLSLTSIVTANAQLEVELTPFAGYYIASDLWSNSGAKVSLSDSFMWGGRLTLNPSRMYGVEFAYTRTGSDAVLDRVQAGQPR